MNISGAVMAHPKRAAWAEDLSDRLGIPIVWDQVNDRHDTGLRCLEAGLAAGPGVTHWLVVQDDAVVCRDLLAGVAKAVEVSGDRIVGLYTGKVKPRAKRVDAEVRTATAAGASWLAMPGPWWGVAIVIPTVHLPALVAAYRASKVENYDRRIQRWATAAGVGCWYTFPSLVDHRAGDENPSLVAGRTSTTRMARRFIGADASALDIDWTRTPVTSPTTAAGTRVEFVNLRTGQTVRVLAGTAAARYDASPRWERADRVEPCPTCGSQRVKALA